MLLENIKDQVSLPCGLFLPREAPEDGKKQIMEYYEVSSENEEVSFELSTASLVVDIYSSTVDLPLAPYNREKEISFRQNLALSLSEKETFVLPEQVKSAVKKALMDDETWSKVKISVQLKNNKVDSLESGALELFPKAKKVILQLCTEN